MTIGKVAIALDHLQGLVSKHFGNFQLVRTVHGKIAGRGVAQVMETKILHARTIARIFPSLGNINGSLSIPTGK